MAPTLTEPIHGPAPGSGVNAKGGAAALQRRLFNNGERADGRPWGGAFSAALTAPKPPKPRDKPRVLRTGAIVPQATPVYERPSLPPIKRLHRHEDGFISFATNGMEGWSQVVSIRADALDTYFPQFAEDLVRDSLVSINASFCTLGQRADAPYGRPLHRISTLRYLNAVYADLDYYDVGLQRWQVIAEVARLECEGILPAHSLTIDTGRGMWLFWMLHHPLDRTRSHLGAYADDLQLYSKVNRSIHRRLIHLGADPIPSAASHVRMDGSFREEAKCFVRWDAHGAEGNGFSYALSDLAAFFGVTARKRLPEEEKAIRQVSRPAGERSKAWTACNNNRLTVLQTLMDARGGGFFEGCRHRGAFYYALGLKGVGVSSEKAEQAVIAMGRDCRPPLGTEDCIWAVSEAYLLVKGKIRTVMLRYQLIADDLCVTLEEAQVISQAIGGKFFPAAQRFGSLIRVTTPAGKDTEEARIANRRAAILEIVREIQHLGLPNPSFRGMADLLHERYGIQISYVTVRTDYGHLGLRSSYSAKTKPSHQELSFGPLEDSEVLSQNCM